jgi:hypothetical protein
MMYRIQAFQEIDRGEYCERKNTEKEKGMRVPVGKKRHW